MARLRIDLTLTSGEESVWSISTGDAETGDAEALIEKLLSMALPEKERMAERAAGCGGKWAVILLDGCPCCLLCAVRRFPPCTVHKARAFLLCISFG